MKKLILFVLILASCYGLQAQTSICLSTQCVATKAHAGDTVLIGAVLNASKGYGSISYSLASGPNTPVLSLVPLTAQSYTTGQMAQQNAQVTGLIAGTYIYTVTGKDQTGAAVTGIDSIVVSPAIAACPPPRTVTSVQINIGGTWYPMPLAAFKFGLSDGSAQ